MRKHLLNFKAALASAMVALVAISGVSCQYDDTDIWDKIGQIEQDIAALQERLDTELAAIKALVEGQVTVKDVQQQSDGSKLIILSDGSRITVYPKGGGYSNLITIVEQDGVKYWAMYDGLGNASPIVVNGNYVPVADIAPQTQIVDGAIEVSFDGGSTWIKTGYTESVADSIIKDVEVVYSDWQTDAEGNPLAIYCKITFADGSVAKVGMQNGKIVLPYDMIFVPYGADVPFTIEVSDVADFINTTPRGWESDVEHNAKKGLMTLTFFAPTLAEVESGEALAEGVAKLMVVFNNGSTAIASIKLSTNPAKVEFTYEGLYLEAGYGTNYLLCGLTTAADFNATNTIANCNKALSENTTVAGVYQLALMESNQVFIPYSELRNAALKANSKYTFWYVAPRSDENDGLYVVESELVTEGYKHSTASLSVTSQSFFDVDVKFDVVGSEGYMLGLVKADEFSAAELAQYYTENYDYLNASRSDVAFKGSILELMESNQPLDYGTEYTLWYIAKNKNRRILEDNVLSWNFSTKGFVEGGALEVEVVGEPVVSYQSIEASINSNGNHIMLIYNVLPSYMATAYPTDELIIEMLMSEGVKTVTDGGVTARFDEAEAGEAVTLFAVAIDQEGLIGKPFAQEFTTKNFEYNDYEVALYLVDYKVDSTLIAVECEGATRFKYLYCAVNDSKWKEVFGGTAKKAGQYIIMNPNSSYVYDTESYPLNENNQIFLKGLSTDTEYVLVCVAVDENGVISQPATCYFEPIANIGNMVKRTDANWAEGKPEILLGGTTEVEFFNFVWYTIPQEGFVAYSMVDHPGNLVSDYFGTNVNTPEKLIAHIVAGCDNGQRDCGHKCVYSADGYSREWQEMEDLDGDGRITFDEWVTYTEDGLPGVYNSYFYGTKGEHRIYITWVGEDGNFHEPFVFNPTTNKEEELNADNFPGYF